MRVLFASGLVVWVLGAAVFPTKSAAIGPATQQHIEQVVQQVYRGSPHHESCDSACEALWIAERRADSTIVEQLMQLRVSAGLFNGQQSSWQDAVAEELPCLRLQRGAEAGTGVAELVGSRGIFLTYGNLPPAQWSPPAVDDDDYGSWWLDLCYHTAYRGWTDHPTFGRWVGWFTGANCPDDTCDPNAYPYGGSDYGWLDPNPCRQYPRGEAPLVGFDVRPMEGAPCGSLWYAEAETEPQLISIARTPDPEIWHGTTYVSWPDPGFEPVQEDVEDALDSPAYAELSSWYESFLSTPEEQRFRPILLFDSEEKWRPLEIERFLAEGSDYPGSNHLWCASPGSSDCAPIMDASSLRIYSDGDRSDDLIDIVGNPTDSRGEYHSPNPSCVQGTEEEPVRLDCDTGPAAAIYWHRTNVQDDPLDELDRGYSFFDYWWFYRYNEFENASVVPDYDHEGDWEGVLVATPPDDPWTFDYAVFDAHGDSWRYLRDVLYCDGDERPGSCGDEWSPSGMRVHAYVAEGSHATYPRPCDTDCAQTVGDGDPDGEDDGLKYEKRFDGLAAWGANDASEALKPFPPANGWDDASAAHWVDWPGAWGVSDSPDSPAHPSRTRYWQPTQLGTSFGCNTERWTDPSWFECNPAGRANARDFVADEDARANPCAPWSGPFVKALICTPKLARAAKQTGRLGKRGNVRAIGLDRDDAVGSAPGLVQVVGSYASGDDAITLEGELPSGTQIRLRSRRGGNTFESIFSGIEMRRGGRLRLSVRNVAGDSVARLTDKHGRREAPDVVIRRDQAGHKRRVR